MSRDKILRWAGQAVLYALFALAIGYFSSRPLYRHLDEDQGLLRMSFKHPGQVLADCRRRTPEELAKVPANMRQEMDCARARSGVRVRLTLDGDVVLDRAYPPAGLSRDGAASGYWRLPIRAGEHRFRVQFSEDEREADFAFEREQRIAVRPGQVVLVDFAPDRGGIQIR